MLITTIPRSKRRGLSFVEQAAIDRMVQQVLHAHRAGHLADGVSWIWADGRPMQPVTGIAGPWIALQVERTAEQWLERRADGFVTMLLRVPRAAQLDLPRKNGEFLVRKEDIHAPKAEAVHEGI